ncbi:MAG: GDYXXLXY domain-containing protein [Muricauda sp.]|nr:GDYXXLXY domain-containing protein [Allomuricauda sp.]MBO6532832.1 GDYXXLXY domain-containing protein [Allomuricauda sp.]MBO6588263.1 GDYXXLXY domain-containing protein [Allomuricauda sp.]MBO6617888.1 GDYXXLXY domain-containing protein [Allomuricauda sp.]MBO6643101.1 GDYXXLXY domain-containing protein [Allomuricauda sp.]MBO6746223.1 GDYXXLXY domain-containing protein [Allomuricauda sp.]
MIGKNTQIIAFVVLALAQLVIPANMIWQQEQLLEHGTEYKFKTAPVDPNDLFRGKYITLSYEASSFDVGNEMDWDHGQAVYVELTTDQKGFAKIASISHGAPDHTEAYVEGSILFVTRNGSNRVTIGYPFDRFYMEESKAQPAEVTYQTAQRDTTKTTYALVRVKNGKAVLKNVLIDGVPIKELVGKELLEND